MTAAVVSDAEIAEFLEFALSLEAWNRANPDHPKDAKGRWAKGSAVGRALQAGESIAGFSREALQREVRRRNRDGAGIKLRRGATVDDIRSALLGRDQSGDTAKRERQKRIDAVRDVGDRVRQLYHDAGAAGMAKDVNKLDEADRRLKRAGGSLFGMPEVVTRYDPKLHKPLDEGVTPGSKVVPIKPGLRWDEEGIVLEKADVQAFDDDERAISDFWKDQEINVHELMKAREKAWQRAEDTPAPAAKPKPKLADITGNPKASNRNTVAAAQKIYGGTFGGLNAKVNEATIADNHSMVIAGDITNAEGHRVGTFTRTIHNPSGGEPYASHGSLYLSPKVHGQGFAEAFNANAINWYRANGVKSIRLYAGDDVGGYAWARAGYDFADKPTAEKMMLRALAATGAGGIPDTRRVDENVKKIPAERLAEQQRLAGDLFDRSESSEFGSVDYPTPYEISQLGRWPGAGKDDMWIGKAIMLGSGWKGVRYL